MKKINAFLLTLLAELDYRQYQLSKDSGVCLSYVNRAIRGLLVLKPKHQDAITKAINRRLPPWDHLERRDIFPEEAA